MLCDVDVQFVMEQNVCTLDGVVSVKRASEGDYTNACWFAAKKADDFSLALLSVRLPLGT